jgi:hypothetical protein
LKMFSSVRSDLVHEFTRRCIYGEIFEYHVKMGLNTCTQILGIY